MTGWWVADLWHQDKPLVFFWAFWVIFSIVLHELGHGVAAIRCGDRTPIETGHMTWNPVVHMGQLSLIMFAIVGIAWGYMPVSPGRMRGRHADAFVSAAGPAVNLGLFALCAIGAALTYDATWTSPRLFEFLRLGAMLNVVLLLLNLLPVPPLDGSRILASFSWKYRQLISHPQASVWAFGAIIAVFFFGGGYLWGIGAGAADGLIGLLAPNLR